MKATLRKTSAVALAVIFTISISGCATPYNKHPDFDARHQKIKSIAIMPPEITVYQLTFKGDKIPLHELVPIMEEATITELKDQFEKKGYTIKELDLSEKVLQEKPELRSALFSVRTIFNKSLEDIRKHRQKKFTYSLGSDVNVFADIADSDVLIFVVEEGVKKSAGEIAKDITKGVLMTVAAAAVGIIYVPIPRTCATVFHIAIVDSNNGDILWYRNNLTSPDIDPENKKHLQSAIRGKIKAFPKITQPKKEEWK